MLKFVMWQYAGGENSGDPPVLWQSLQACRPYRPGQQNPDSTQGKARVPLKLVVFV